MEAALFNQAMRESLNDSHPPQGGIGGQNSTSGEDDLSSKYIITPVHKKLILSITWLQNIIQDHPTRDCFYPRRG